MDTKKLRQKILDLAIRGKLVPQDPNDEPASVLLERIKAEKERLIKEGKIKRTKKTAKTSDTPHYENVPFEVPEGWVWCRLDDIAFIGTGATPSTSNKSYYDKGNIAWISSGATNQPFINEASNFITEKALSETNCKIYPIGTLIVAMYGEGKTRGQVSELSIEAATNQACAAIKPYVLEIKSYIKLYLESNYLYLRKLAEGGNQPNLSVGKISAYTIPLPPLVEQRRIVSEIEHWFSLINIIEGNKEDLQASIKQAKSKIFDLAIHGKLVPQDSNDEPASELLKRINPKVEITCDNGHYQNLPTGWALCRLENIVDYEQPTDYIVNSTNYDNNYPIPVLTAGKSFIIGYTNDIEGIYSKLPCIIFDDFTTDSKFVDFPFKVKSSAMKLLQVKHMEVEYVAMFMSITRLIGDTHKRYWISEYSKLLIPIPPYAEQKRIVAAVHKVFTQIDTIMESL